MYAEVGITQRISEQQ